MIRTIKLPFKLRVPALACGADMKGAFAIARGDKAYLEDGFGDLSDPDNLARYGKAVVKLTGKLGVKPGVVICDMHPGYLSTRFAEGFGAKVRRYMVQHHEAHVASAVIDSAIKGGVIGVAFDGTGFGSDGNIWGGEFFVGSPKYFKRSAHLEYVHMPGGDSAVREPWRMAASHIFKAIGADFSKNLREGDRALYLKTMIDRNINSPLTSSAGRLFDAVGSMILGAREAAFEAQLPAELEKMAPDGYEEHYRFDLKEESGLYTIRVDGVIKGIVKDMTRGLERRFLSGRFHNTMAQIISATAEALRKRGAPRKVVLTGGVFQNRYLTSRARALLTRRGFRVYTHTNISATDAGIPVGQIAIARARGICV
jgi:hydrogenase maturation protein HypF